MTDYTSLRKALDYAIQIIESYELDIRSRPDLVAAGFCQGVVYRNVVEDVRRMAGIETAALPARAGEDGQS